MLFTPFFLLLSLGQAQRLQQSTSRRTTLGDSTAQLTQVNGTLTSFSILEGNGCPAGTYHPQPFEPGTLSTFVDFDSFVFNGSSSSEPLRCTLNVNFEFTYPEDGVAGLEIDTIAVFETKYEEGDETKVTNFVINHDMAATAGDSERSAGVDLIRVLDGPSQAQIGFGLEATGTPGEVALGTYQTAFTIFTRDGPGELAVSRIAMGFGRALLG